MGGPLTSELDCPIAGLVPGRLRTTNLASESSFHRLEAWIGSCNREHGATCGARRLVSAKLPTRVLDIEFDSQRVKLVDTSDQRGAYITLSHRWGGSGVIKTEKSTLAAWQSGISLQALPQTFLDAVLVAKRLKIRYLWVDSLCIIQDSDIDWERESSKMAEIYSNSYLTIAASSSPDSNGGLFSTWDRRSGILQVSPDAVSLGAPIIPNSAPLLDTRDEQYGPAWVSDKRFVFLDVSYNDKPSRIYIHLEWIPSSIKNARGHTLLGRLVADSTLLIPRY